MLLFIGWHSYPCIPARRRGTRYIQPNRPPHTRTDIPGRLIQPTMSSSSSQSSLYQPRPVLSSQRFSPAPDYIDTRRSFHGDSRLPLRESTGNVQQQHHQEPSSAHSSFNGGSLVGCYQTPVTLSPSMQSSIPPPAPIVPSQSFDCLRSLQATASRQHHHVPPPLPQVPTRYSQRGKPRNSINPLYFWPAFRQYRNRQAHKDTQKDKGGVWRRPELEDAFVDCKSTHLCGASSPENALR